METPIHVLFVIDASGSMLPRAEDVRGGFNAYIETLREDTATKYLVSAVAFDTQVRNLFTDRDLDDVPELSPANYKVGGNTALYDAIGLSVNLLTNQIATLGKRYGQDRVVCIIMTDGEENSSRTFDRSTIIGKIARRTTAGNWTFVYLGADQDAWAHAQQLGIGFGNTVAYDGTQTRSTFDGLAGQTVQYAHSNTTSSNTFMAGGTVNTSGTAVGGTANTANATAPSATLGGSSSFMAVPQTGEHTDSDDSDNQNSEAGEN